MGERQGCNDIARAMLANEFKEYDEIEKRSHCRIWDYSEKLYPFLRKLYSINGLDTDGELKLEKLDESTYNYFKEKMIELSLDFGTDNIHRWIPSVITIKKTDYDLFDGKWAKSEDGILFMYRLNNLLFEVAGRHNPKIKDKSYYDRLTKVQKDYFGMYSQLNEKNKKSVKKAEIDIVRSDSETMTSYLERIEKKIEDRRNGVENGETISLIRIRNNILRTIFSSYRRKNTNGCYNKEIKELKERMEGSRDVIFPKDYYNEYLKLSIINDEFQFPYEILGAKEEIYYRCRDEYKNNPRQDIDKMIHEITQSVYREYI